MLKKEKQTLENWRTGSFSQNLAWIQAAVSEKPESTGDGRLRHDSSSADKVKQS